MHFVPNHGHKNIFFSFTEGCSTRQLYVLRAFFIILLINIIVVFLDISTSFFPKNYNKIMEVQNEQNTTDLQDIFQTTVKTDSRKAILADPAH